MVEVESTKTLRRQVGNLTSCTGAHNLEAPIYMGQKSREVIAINMISKYSKV